jgi:membrane-associated protein
MPGTDLLNWLAARLVTLGPGVLFVICLLETAVFAGLILPVGALIAFAAMLASRGLFQPEEVIAVALLGALSGDQVGFVVGRWFVAGARPPRGDIARIWHRALARAEGLIHRRGLLGITASRAIPFVRTVMPWFAGRSGVGWGRFLLFDVFGVMLWGLIYIGGGFVACEGWRQVSGEFGEIAGAVLAIIVVLAFVLVAPSWSWRILRRSRAERAVSEPAPQEAGEE